MQGRFSLPITLRDDIVQSHQHSKLFGSENRTAQARRRQKLRVGSRPPTESPFEDFARTAQRASSQAWTKLNQAYLVVDGQFRRTASEIDNKFDVSKKAQRARDQMSEQARFVDSRYGLKRRLQNVSDDVQRKWPLWRKRYTEFSKTLPGQALFVSFVFLLFWTGTVWRLLNLVFIAWWLSPFLFLLLSRFNDKAAGEQKRRQQQQQKQQQQRQFFNSFFQSQRKASQREQPGTSNRRKYGNLDEGPVIDVEYTTIDE